MKRIMVLALIAAAAGLSSGCCCRQNTWGQPAYYPPQGNCQPVYGQTFAQPGYGAYQPAGCQCW